MAKVLVLSAVRRRQKEGGMRMVKVSPEIEVKAREEEREERERNVEKERAPPMSHYWDDKSMWTVSFTSQWRFEEHNNVTEARTTLWAIRRAARIRAEWGKRLLIFSDSAVTIGALMKGRSSSWGLLRQCRKAAHFCLGLGLQLWLRYVPSQRNNEDGPSRGFGIGVAPKALGQTVPKILFEVSDDQCYTPQGSYGQKWQGFG